MSFNWAKLLARIYEINPLLCSRCGKEIKIITFVTHTSAIWRILKGIGLPRDIPEFDPEYDLERYEVSQLVSGTKDGFPEIHAQLHPETGPDPPWQDVFDSPYDDGARDLSHWED